MVSGCFILGFLFIYYPSMYAQERLTLQECLETGILNNYSLQLLRLQEETAQRNVTPGNAGKLPVVNLNAPYSGSYLSTDRQLRDGGSSNTDPSLTHTLNPNVSITYSLFEGYAARYSSKILQSQLESSGLKTRKGIEDYMAHLAAAYYTYAYQLLQFDNFASAVALSNERVRIVKDRYDLGSASKLDLLQAQVDLNADSSYMVSLYERVSASRISLRNMMSSDDYSVLGNAFVPYDTTIPINKGINRDRLMDISKTNNVSILIVENDKNIAGYEYNIVKSRAYPYVRANASFGTQISAYGDGTYKRQLTVGPNFGLSMGLRLYDGFNQKRQEQNAVTGIKQHELYVKETRQNVVADLLIMYDSYSNNLRLLDLEEENLKVATENLNVAKERYLLGELSGIEMREAQQRWLDAKQRLIQVNYQAKLAEISLNQLAGLMTEYL